MLFKFSKTTAIYLKKTSGFTIVEVVVGIVALSISLSIISTLISPAEQQSAAQIHQVKAAELGQSFLNDITARAFDENSDMAGGLVRCGEPLGSNACTDADKLGPENGETERGQFNDVDDFNNYSKKFTANDESLEQGYTNFIVNISVVYDGLSLGLPSIMEAKKITVSITTPLGTEIKFATHKANF
ncbi:MAG: MSHA biogenesis protein MshD [Colwellia sp.]|nr:MSHA biogenesis protein MshD [Colwellia sp.]